MVDGLAGERRAFETGDGGDVDDGALFAGPHCVVEGGVGGVHEAVDVGGGHLLDLVDGEFPETGGRAEG